jgi:hypothetical protein
MQNHQAAYMAGIIDALGTGVGVHFRWDEMISTIVIRGPPPLLEWIAAMSGHPSDPEYKLWAIQGAELLSLLKAVRPHLRIKTEDVDKMIAWLEEPLRSNREGEP